MVQIRAYGQLHKRQKLAEHSPAMLRQQLGEEKCEFLTEEGKFCTGSHGLCVTPRGDTGTQPFPLSQKLHFSLWHWTSIYLHLGIILKAKQFVCMGLYVWSVHVCLCLSIWHAVLTHSDCPGSFSEVSRLIQKSSMRGPHLSP